MVDFCPECSGLLKKQVLDGVAYLVCRCGYKKSLDKSLEEEMRNEKIQKKKKDLDNRLIVVSEEDKINVHPLVKKECPHCGNLEAEAWQEQTRSADEPSTSFFRCTKCRKTWREY